MSRSTVPRWFLIGLVIWALVYCPLVLYLLDRAQMHWMFSFAAVIVPLWFGVRVWVHQSTRRRAERLQRSVDSSDTSEMSPRANAPPTDDDETESQSNLPPSPSSDPQKD